MSRETERLSRDLNKIRRLSSYLRHGETRPIRLVSTPVLAQSLISEVICCWREFFPKALCELSSHHTLEIIQSLLLRESDIGLTFQPVVHSGLKTQVIGEGRIMVIAPPNWWTPEEMSSPILLNELAGMPLIALENDDVLGSALRDQLSLLTPPPQINTWVQTYQLARSLVSAGQGLALVDPITALDNQYERLQARPLEPVVPVQIYALCRIDKAHGPREHKLLELASKVAISLLQMNTGNDDAV
ncbi:MAG: LysR substrate-binding domain-containing protein [Oceanisphaera sp.]|uniref:LysR substrate-binding domain-containing protein n=1 Tax=Oceanisphaera sp. TaxID=1929979 RepID=UPI003C74B9EF